MAKPVHPSSDKLANCIVE